MHGPEGDFHNPFDRGWRRNCVDTCKPTAAPASPFVLRCAPMCHLARVEVLWQGWVGCAGSFCLAPRTRQ